MSARSAKRAARGLAARRAAAKSSEATTMPGSLNRKKSGHSTLKRKGKR